MYMNLRLPLTAVFALLALSFVACGKNEAPPVDTAKEQAAGRQRGERKRDARNGNRCVRLCLSAGHDGVYATRAHEHRETGRNQGADGPIRAYEGVSERLVQRRDRTECGYSLYAGMVRRL